MRNWPTNTVSKPNSRKSEGQKFSLRNMRQSTQGSQHLSKATTKLSHNRSSKKKSLKNLNSLSVNLHNFNNHYQSMNYEDIRTPVVRQNNYFSFIFCGQNTRNNLQGCKCIPKCKWMNHWIQLSLNTSLPQCQYGVSKKNQQQIRKDLGRTQSDFQQFQTAHYQQVLYNCLVAYSSIDPEVGYVQGMNIICSAIIYHGTNLNQCLRIFKFLMITCGFRTIFLGNFQFAYKLSKTVQQYLNYRCHDLYRHMIIQCQINMSMFIIGWLLPMLGNIIPLSFMHLVINGFLQKSWGFLTKIVITMFLYLKNQILEIDDQSDIMHLFSIQKLKDRQIDWEQVIQSSNNIKTLPFTNI